MSIVRRPRQLVVTLGAVTALIGTFLPWVESGSSPRSSYEVFDIVDRLGFSPDGAVGWALRLWPVVPLALVATVVAEWWVRSHRQQERAVAVLVVCTAIYAGGAALALATADEVAVLSIRIGPTITATGCAVMLLGLLLPRSTESVPLAALDE